MNAPIVEIFKSIQGEGKNLGHPCIFVRFWGCNLRCQFAGTNCDTPYAVTDDKDKVKMMNPFEVASKIEMLGVKHIVFTGGEPMLYQPFIAEVLDELDLGYDFCEIETNGTIKLIDKLKSRIDLFNISLKLKSSNQKTSELDKLRYDPDVVASFLGVDSCFKFVVTSDVDVEEIKGINKEFPSIKIFLMPEGATREAIITHSPNVVRLCIENNWIFSPREHIMIWDTRKGV